MISKQLKEDTCIDWFKIVFLLNTALQAVTILVAMASGKNIWRLKFW